MNRMNRRNAWSEAEMRDSVCKVRKFYDMRCDLCIYFENCGKEKYKGGQTLSVTKNVRGTTGS